MHKSCVPSTVTHQPSWWNPALKKWGQEDQAFRSRAQSSEKLRVLATTAEAPGLDLSIHTAVYNCPSVLEEPKPRYKCSTHKGMSKYA